jgi:maltose/moltooligosaccharide transporter
MKLNYSKTFLLGFGFFGVSIIWATYNFYVPIFLAEKFNLSPSLVGFFMTLDNIAALLIQPPVGAWSDKLRTPLGRRMPFILIGAPISAVAFGLVPLASALPLFAACTITLILSMAFWRTPVIALMPDITPSKYRSQANGIINFMGGIGFIVASVIGSRLYDINTAYPFWLGSVLVIVSAMLVFTFIREPKIPESIEKQPGMIESLSYLSKEKDYSGYRLLGAIFFWFVAYSALDTFFTSYAKYYLDIGESNGSLLLSQLSLFFIIFAIPSGYIGGKVGRRPTIMTGIAIMTVVLICIFLIPVNILNIELTKLPILGVVPVLGIFLMIAGIGWSLININSLPMVVDLTDEVHIGTYTGLYYLSSTLAAIVGPNVNGWVIQLTNNNYNSIMVVASFFMVVAFLLMIGVKRGEAQKADSKSDVPSNILKNDNEDLVQ